VGSEKWEQHCFLAEIHEKATITIKVLTQELIEGKVPICTLLDQYSNPSKHNVSILLHRIEKLFNAREEAIKIFKLTLELFHVPQETLV
jgi:hypothetical protein